MPLKLLAYNFAYSKNHSHPETFRRKLFYIILIFMFVTPTSGICGTFEDIKTSIDDFYEILEDDNWPEYTEIPHVPSEGMRASAQLIAASISGTNVRLVPKRRH